MGFFNKFKKNNDKMDDYELFSHWLDNVLEQKLPQGIIAFNFNLYEGNSGTYDIQLIGSDEFDDDDGDWACTDYFSTGENICYIKRTQDIEEWVTGLYYITKLVERYLKEGRYANVLKTVKAVGIGFVDGDIKIVYRESQG